MVGETKSEISGLFFNSAKPDKKEITSGLENIAKKSLLTYLTKRFGKDYVNNLSFNTVKNELDNLINIYNNYVKKRGVINNPEYTMDIVIKIREKQ